jgi:hypothetical protein
MKNYKGWVDSVSSTESSGVIRGLHSNDGTKAVFDEANRQGQ